LDTQYYVESDGRIYLVQRGDALDLPFADEIPFDVEPIARLHTGEPVWFCVPRLDGHPHTWPGKDDVPTMDDVTPLVREAVHATMPRVVVEGVCLRQQRILLVKGGRGLTKDRWTLPGGFLRFGESPREGVLRELREEIGAEGAIRGLLHVDSKLGRHTGLHWIMLFYRIQIDGDPVPNPDEIAEVRFVDFAEAEGLVADEVMCQAIRRIAGRMESESERSPSI